MEIDAGELFAYDSEPSQFDALMQYWDAAKSFKDIYPCDHFIVELRENYIPELMRRICPEKQYVLDQILIILKSVYESPDDFCPGNILSVNTMVCLSQISEHLCTGVEK